MIAPERFLFYVCVNIRLPCRMKLAKNFVLQQNCHHDIFVALVFGFTNPGWCRHQASKKTAVEEFEKWSQGDEYLKTERDANLQFVVFTHLPSP